MPSSSRSGYAVLVAWALAQAGCSSGGATPKSCQSGDECPSGARCLSSACVSNAAPLPVIAVPSALEAHDLLTFDGTASSDPDADDSVVTYAWAFRAVDAACAPPVVAGTAPSAIVRFGCPGAYEVALTVTDEMGASATATRPLPVAARAGAPLVVVGPDVSVDHLCAGTPARCAPAGVIALSAHAPELAAEDLTWAWTVEPPPDRPLDAQRRVALSPSPNVPSPTVAIETDGQAISGDWIFRVEARDAAGVVGTGAVRVSVLNRSPVVTESIPVFAHAFDPAAAELRSAEEIGLEVVDPDGDALVGRSVTGNHSGDGSASFRVTDLGSRIGVEVRVPYAQLADAAYLIGPGPERSVTFTIRDVNGAFVSESWPVVIANRPPIPVTQPALVQVDHAYDEGAALYTARATLSSWADPDGDPLLPGATGDATCSALTVVGAAAEVACSMPFTGMPTVAAFATTRALTYEIRDPWTAAPLTTSLRILNRSPRLSKTSAGPAGLCHVSDVCCELDPELGCTAYGFTSAAAEFDVLDFAVDDDGDPLEVVASSASATLTPTQAVCMPAECAVHVSDAGTASCGSPTTDAIELRLRDGGPEVVRTVSYSGCR